MAPSLEALPEETWAPRDVVAQSPYTLIGDRYQIVDTLLERRERWGLSYYVIFEEEFDHLRPVVAALAGT